MALLGLTKYRIINYANIILSDSPIGYWKADEPSGTTLIDSSGNGHHGTYTAAVHLNQTPLRTGAIASINTTTNSVAARVTPSGALLINASDFTLECVVKKTINVGGSVYAGFFGYGADIPEQPGVVYRYGANKSNITCKIYNNTEIVSPNSTAGTIVLMQMVYTYLGGTAGNARIDLYEKGVLVVTGNAARIGTDTPPLNFLGCQGSVPGSVGFIGGGSDFAMYNYPLSAARCLVHAQAAGLT